MKSFGHSKLPHPPQIFIFLYLFSSPVFADSKSAIKNHLSFKGPEIVFDCIIMKSFKAYRLKQGEIILKFRNKLQKPEKKCYKPIDRLFRKYFYFGCGSFIKSGNHNAGKLFFPDSDKQGIKRKRKMSIDFEMGNGFLLA